MPAEELRGGVEMRALLELAVDWLMHTPKHVRQSNEAKPKQDKLQPIPFGVWCKQYIHFCTFVITFS